MSFTPSVSAGRRMREKIIYWVIQWYVVSIMSTIPDLKLNSGQSMEVEVGDERSLESLLLPQSRHLLLSSTLLPNLPPPKASKSLS